MTCIKIKTLTHQKDFDEGGGQLSIAGNMMIDSPLFTIVGFIANYICSLLFRSPSYVKQIKE
jgi:hypothetical protein